MPANLEERKALALERIAIALEYVMKESPTYKAEKQAEEDAKAAAAKAQEDARIAGVKQHAEEARALADAKAKEAEEAARALEPEPMPEPEPSAPDPAPVVVPQAGTPVNEVGVTPPPAKEGE